MSATQITKVFFLADLINGEFKENSETVSSNFFDFSELTDLKLDLGKTTVKQIEMCFEAYNDEKWQTLFD